MTLGDFFTLTEMKNGISTPARVEELINTMQHQNNCSITNISDAIRQWTSVLSTITATDNEDCLNLFIKLKGLSYFSQWVQDALKVTNENRENIIEDFFTVLLGSLEKFPVIEEDPAASEMQLICEKLLELESLNIEERARALIKRWTHAMEIDASLSNKDNGKDANIDAVENGKPIVSDSDNVNDSELDEATDLLNGSLKKGTSAIVLNSSQENLSAGYVNEEDNLEIMKMNVDEEQVTPTIPDQETSKAQSSSNLSLSNASELKSDADSKEAPSDNMEEDGSRSTGEVKADSPEPSEKRSTPMVDQNSDYGLEYGEIDALEVARQVAIEVEREVVDYREPVCSPSPNHSSNDSEKINVAPDQREAEQLGKEITQEEGSSEAEKGKCVFDLNEDICIEEPGPFVNSNPNVTLKFEGEASSSRKRKAKCMEFDLNVVDNEGEEESVEVSSKKHEKVGLDLNQIGDEEKSHQPQPYSYWSSAASSSSSKQPEIRGFDLNNNPLFFDVMGVTKKPEITIMGLKITERKEGQMTGPDLQGPYSQFLYGQFPAPGFNSNGNVMGSSLLDFDFPSYNYGMPLIVPPVQSAMPHFLMSSNNVIESSQSGLEMSDFFMPESNLAEHQVRAIRGEPQQPQGSHSGNELFNFMSPWP